MFCENCGTKLLPDSRFCENCGWAVEPLASTETEPLFDVWQIFTKSDWSIKWCRVADSTSANLGIILTNTKNCESLETFRKALDEYIHFKAKRGVAYYVLDMETQCVTNCRGSSLAKDVVEVLKHVYQCKTPEYLMIVGDKDAIGTTRWKFRTRNEDENVDSDLPYITLDVQSPWKGQNYRFDECSRVARVPAQAKNGFVEACTYFRCVMKNQMSPHQEIRGFSLSAKVWDGVSKKIHKSNIEEGVYYCCPPKDKRDFLKGLPRINGKQANLLYFNLHGSDKTEEWYGEDNKKFFPAFSAECLSDFGKGYMIGTEACYGAKPIFKRTPTILTYALQNGCLAFLGSSQIAYGSVKSGAVCADVMIGEYLKHLVKGNTAGEAFLEGMKSVAGGLRKSDTEILTLAEFALYGDPSCSLLEQEYNFKAFTGVHKSGYYVPMPDVRRAVELKLATISAEMKTRMLSYVREHYEQFAEYSPQYYEVSGYGGYQAVYEKPSEYGVNVLKVYFDSDGNVGQIYMSK